MRAEPGGALDARLRFSSHAAPQVRMGGAVLYPQNMKPGADRLAFLYGAVAYLNGLLTEQAPLTHVRELARRIPVVGEMLEVVGEGSRRARARPIRGIEDALRFDRRRLTVCFPNGQFRSAAPYGVASGEQTPGVGRMCQALRRGETRRRLHQMTRRLPGAADLLRALEEHGIVKTARPAPPPSLPSTSREVQVSWLGHAAVVLQSGATTCWVDPYLPPLIRWTAAERRSLFSKTFAEARLFEDYGPSVRQLCPHDLPAPDAVFLTHQDRDHVDVGLLMTLPDSVRIVVPRASPERPWEVDLQRFLRQVLGDGRRIAPLGHGETMNLGAFRVTAFPFRGEMPEALPHSWNCYAFETSSARVVCTADSHVEESAIEFLARAHRARPRPLSLMTTMPSEPRGTIPGWREEAAELYNPWRLYSWYLPVLEMFRPCYGGNVSFDALRRLKREAGLKGFFCYASGSAPWFRLPAEDPFALRVNSLSFADWSHLERRVRGDRSLPRLLPLKYGMPFPLGA